MPLHYEKEKASVFAALKEDSNTNIATVAAAVAALEKGMAGSFLQTSAAQILRKCMQGKPKLNANREEILSFLSSEESEYAPQSGEITGILKEMGDEMAKELSTATGEESTAIKEYEFAAAKKKKIDAISASIESTTQRIDELTLSIVQMKKTDKGFLSQLDHCALLDKNENNMLSLSDFIALTVQGRLVFNSHCYPNCHHKGDIDCYPICEAEAISKEYCSKQSIQDTDTHYVSSVRRKMQSVSNASIKRWGRRRRGRRTRRRR